MTSHPQGLIRPHHSRLALVYRLSDMFLILATLWLSTQLRGIAWTDFYAVAGLTAVLLFSLTAEGTRLYRSWRAVPFKQYMQPLFATWVITVCALLALGYLSKTTGTYSRLAITTWMLLVPAVLLAWRVGIRAVLSYMRALGHNTRTVAIAGANEQGDRLARLIQADATHGLRLVGFFDDRGGESPGRVNPNLPVGLLGGFDDLVARARQGEIDLIYIVLPLKGQDRINEIIAALRDTTASVYLVPDFFVFNLLHSCWVNIGHIPTISVFESPFYGAEGWLKRIEDVVLSSLILSAVAVPMVLIAVGVKLSSPGPIIFKQRRYGLDGKAIQVWKFRTMTVCEDGPRVTQARHDDSRVTPLGAVLRRTSLDELPQFINVLRGDMSIVGPRPHAVSHNEEYRKLIDGYMLRHKVKPGITGWAQINGWRGETDTLEKMRKRVELDLWYISSWSVWLDLKIIIMTAAKGFVGNNAY